MPQMIDVCEIRAHVLKAHLGIAATRDTRYYLEGMFVDVARARLVSTDGVCLLVTKQEMTERAAAVTPFILKRELISAALKSVAIRGKRRAATRITVQVSSDTTASVRQTRLVVELAAQEMLTDTEIDGRYPDYERVIPRTPSGATAAFNPMHLAQLHQALALAQNRDVTRFPVVLLHNAPFSGLMVGADNALGVITTWDGEPRKPHLQDISATRALENLGFPVPAA